METIVIPPIANTNEKDWQQPPLTEILVDEACAMMDQKAFDQLREFSTDYPKPVYLGKMWKAKQEDTWHLCWYGKSEIDPDKKCSLNHKPIQIV